MIIGDRVETLYQTHAPQNGHTPAGARGVIVAQKDGLYAVDLDELGVHTGFIPKFLRVLSSLEQLAEVTSENS